METLVQIGSIGLDSLHLIFLFSALLLGGALYWLENKRKAETLEANLKLDVLETASEEAKTQRLRAEEAERQLAAAGALEAKSREQFETMAQTVLRGAQQQFMNLANETFAKHKEGAKGDLEKLMGPIGENFAEFKKRVDELEKVRVADKSTLQAQVKAIGESLHRSTTETGKLVNALTAPRGGGRWGEMTLRNVMEQAGLSAHCDFDEQVSDATEDGRQRPDAVIHLPGDREIVIDSKVSLEAYMQAAAEEDPTKRAVHLKAHATNVQRHVDALASKRYQDNLDERVDFVAMFIPGENFFAAALEHAPELLERAYSKGVIVTTPSTLIGLAKTVGYVWRQEKMAENARAAAGLGEELYRRMGTLAEHMDKLGKSLKGAVGHYNSMNGSFDTRVLPALRKLEELSIAPPDKTIEGPKLVEATPRLSDRSGELDVGEDAA
ncbi:MAG: DNA recombination protein RmuC [Pseudomonadota bacterium]